MKRFLAGKFSRDTSGATAVEFALIAVPLLLFLIGAIEIGRMMWIREALHSTAIAGARCMGVREAACAPGGVYSATSTRTFIRNYALSLRVAIPDARISVNNAATCSGTTGFSEVIVTYDFESILSPLLALNPTSDLSATACFPNQA